MAMTASFWVYLSTILFLLIVFYLSKGIISSLLDKKRQDIINTLEEVKQKQLKAEALYDQYRKKMDNLEAETETIVKNAEKTAQSIIESAKVKIEEIKILKEKEALRKITQYEIDLKKNIIAEVSEAIVKKVMASSQSSLEEAMHTDFSEISHIKQVDLQ